MQAYAGRQFGVAVVERNPSAVVQPDDADDIVDLERMRQKRMTHIFARRVSKLSLLEMEARSREAIKITNVIVVKMGQITSVTSSARMSNNCSASTGSGR
jgi:hypothetical protein